MAKESPVHRFSAQRRGRAPVAAPVDLEVTTAPPTPPAAPAAPQPTRWNVRTAVLVGAILIALFLCGSFVRDWAFWRLQQHEIRQALSP